MKLLLLLSLLSFGCNGQDLTEVIVLDKGKSVSIKLELKDNWYQSFTPLPLDTIMRIKDQLPCKDLAYFRQPLNSETWIFFCKKK